MNPKFEYSNDSVKFIAKHIKATGTKITRVSKERDKLISNCLIEYHITKDQARKKELRDCVLMNIWYLFPYILSFYKLKGNIFDDTLQLMIISAMKAIENFKPKLGYKFSSYISGYLKDAISNSLKSNMVVKCPAAHIKDQEIVRLKPMLDDSPKVKRGYTELNIDDNVSLTDIANDIVNKNKPTGLCVLTAEDDLINNQHTQFLRDAINQKGLLTQKEKAVLIFRFGLSGVPRLTLSQVASIFRGHGNRASKVWIFQIEQKAKAKLKRYFIRNKLV